MDSNDPFLFSELSSPLPEAPVAFTPVPVYTTPIEQATFDIMELVDSFFRSSVTVEEYDGIQRKVKSILLEAFDEKKPVSPPAHGSPLLVVRHDTQN